MDRGIWIPVGHHAQGRRTHALCPDRSCAVGVRSSRRAAPADIARAPLFFLSTLSWCRGTKFAKSGDPQGVPAMTPDQKHLVRESWKQVVPTAEAAAELFYRRLFEIDPTTPALFRATDMFAQRTKLLKTLGF